MKRIDKIEGENLYWLAGLLEGEASFCYVTNQKYRFPVSIRISMCDEDVIKKVAGIFNTKVFKDTYGHRKNRKYKIQYRVVKCGFRALRLMQMLYPMMGKRRQKQIKYLFQKCGLIITEKLPNKHRGSCKVTWEQIDKIRKRFQNGESPYKIAKNYPISGSHTSNICYNRKYNKKSSLFTQAGK